MDRNNVTEAIIVAKRLKGLSWIAIADKIGQSKEWTTAGCLGQMTFTKEQASKLGKQRWLRRFRQKKWLR